jgi:hypothetical protein
MLVVAIMTVVVSMIFFEWFRLFLYKKTSVKRSSYWW